MTKTQYTTKKEHLANLRKQYKYSVIHEDSATRVNHLKELIESVENELKSYENNL